ncbi:hypothetical protein [Streptomyces sp. LN699]|uniref:hypothetical protein n=1 Tax=Streptomyces sp. LN699 TaxID=3112981 RepID=UPI0037202C5A
MEWGTLVATLGGGLIALAGTVMADRLRTRQEHRRGLQARRRDVYREFIAAAGAAHTELRCLAQNGPPASALFRASRAAYGRAAESPADREDAAGPFGPVYCMAGDEYQR